MLSVTRPKRTEALMSPTLSSPFSLPSSNPQGPPGSRHGRGPDIPFQAAISPASPCRAVTLFFSLLSDRLGAIRGCSRQNVAVPRRAQRRVHPLIRFDRPALAGLRDHYAQFGRCDVPGGGTHLHGRCRNLRCLRRTMVPAGHTPCPGSPEGPFGPPGCPDVSLSSSQARDRTAPSGTSPAVA